MLVRNGFRNRHRRVVAWHNSAVARRVKTDIDIINVFRSSGRTDFVLRFVQYQKEAAFQILCREHFDRLKENSI